MIQNEIILTFSGTSQAIQAESILLGAAFPVGVMPLPGDIRAGCGICLRLTEDTADTALALLREVVPVQAAYLRMLSGSETRYLPYPEEVK